VAVCAVMCGCRRRPPPLVGGVLERGHVEPLLNRLPDGDVGLRVLVLVDLALELCQRLLGRLRGFAHLAYPALAGGQRIDAAVDDGPERATGQLLDVARVRRFRGGMYRL
jgi:hypothetical protein